MKIIPRYVLRHFFPVFGLALFAIVGLYLIIDFFEKVDNLLEKHVPGEDIFFYFLLKIPFILTQGIPMASLLGSLLALGILKRNRELFALETAGIIPNTWYPKGVKKQFPITRPWAGRPVGDRWRHTRQ